MLKWNPNIAITYHRQVIHSSIAMSSAKKHHKDFFDYEISVDTLLCWREGNGVQAKNVWVP